MGRLFDTAVLLVALAAAAGCRNEIGDSCTDASKCEPPQVCDISVAGGYCILYDCEEGGCPDEAVCVDFDVLTACMRRCDNDRDCRPGHTCRTDLGPAPFCYIAPE